MPTSTREARQRRAARAAITVAVSLAIAKVITGLVVNSVAVLASAVDSLLDVFASTVNLVAIRIAHAPADDDHRFGHAKAEALATAAQALLIGGSAAYLLVEGGRRVFAPQAFNQPSIGLVVMGVAALASAVLVAYMRRVARATASSALLADATHYQTDVLANLAVLAGVALGWLAGITWIDGVLTIAVAFYVGASAFSLLRGATKVLMDAEIPDEERRRIVAVIEGFRDRVGGFHGLRTRSAGRRVFVEVHLELDADISLRAAHDVGLEVEHGIRGVLPSAHVLVHLDFEKDEHGYEVHGARESQP